MSSTPLQHQSVSPALSSDQREAPDEPNEPSDRSRNHAHFVDASAAIAAAAAVNRRNAHANSIIDIASDFAADTAPSFASPLQFRSYTIAPSPPVLAPGSRCESPSIMNQDPAADDSSRLTHSPDLLAHARESTLHLQTNLGTSPSQQNSHSFYGYSTPGKSTRRPALSLQHKSSAQSLRLLSRTPSLRSGSLHGAFGSASAASSTVPSPVISAMGDVTPLPSPLLAGDSPGPWKQFARRRDSALSHTAPTHDESAITPTAPPKGARKPYGGITSWPAPAEDARQQPEGGLAQPPLPPHTRNRSISEYIPDPMLIPKRMSTVSGARMKPEVTTAAEAHMRREPHLSEIRGLTPIEKPPTPPPSESSSSAADSSSVAGSGYSTRSSKQARAEFFEAYGRYDKKLRRWRAVRVLGQGTFSRVYLATSQTSSSHSDDEDCSPGSQPVPERRSLVAIKICEHGPRGGASEDRIEMSLKRELEIMQSIRHPSLVHLKAWNIEPTRAVLVLSYYPGGDLFDVATRHRKLLTPSLIRRMFSELVGAVTYLHDQNVVHRDIKLENVLVNLPPSELAAVPQPHPSSSSSDPSSSDPSSSDPSSSYWSHYPHPVITLTDLGLSRRLATPDEKLETRCGSDDYAAPEVIMGQPYDGRATDAWSLGVLLYALLEARLPFDPPPQQSPGAASMGLGLVSEQHQQMRMRSRTSHRIARVEWRWYEFGVGGEEEGEGEHEADEGKFVRKGLVGAREVVEGLLKRARSRWPLGKVAGTEWVRGGVGVEGGVRFREEEEGEEVVAL